MSFEFFRFPDGRSQPHPALPLRGSRWEVAHFHGQFMTGKIKKNVLYARHRWICGVRMAGTIPSSALHDLQFEVVNGVTAISQQLVSGCLKGMLAREPPVKSSRSCGAPVTTAALTPQLVSFRHCPNWFRLTVRLSQNQGRQTGEWLA